jgi:hypothetical protein
MTTDIRKPLSHHQTTGNNDAHPDYETAAAVLQGIRQPNCRSTCALPDIRTPAVILCCCWGLNRTCPHKTSVHSSSTGELVLRPTQPVTFGEAWGAHTIWCGLLARC